MEPEHISVYSLILEEGTPLFKKVEEGLELPDEELERKMYWNVKRILGKWIPITMKYQFCKNKYESKHNLDCWNQKEYIGFGIAATFIYKWNKVFKYRKFRTIYKIMKRINRPYSMKTEMEAMQKNICYWIRKIDGVSIQEFKIKFVANPVFLYHDKLEKLVNEELVEIDGAKLS